MTYLVPDDWYANHGLAPGDARRPQRDLEPRPGNLAPTPPVRGYFGRPPVARLTSRAVAIRPFMDTDRMWGVNGLGDVNAILERLQKTMKEEALKQAAISTGISIGLSVIPVVGWAASAIYAVVQGLMGSKYQRESQEVMAYTEIEAKRIAAEYEAKLADVQNRLFLAERDNAVALATSCEALNGLGNIFDKIGKEASRAVKKLDGKKVLKLAVAPYIALPVMAAKEIAKQTDNKLVHAVADPLVKADRETDRVLDQVSGRSQLDAARKASQKILAEVRATLEQQYQSATVQMNSPEFRACMRVSIAKQLRADASMSAMLKTKCGKVPFTGEPGCMGPVVTGPAVRPQLPSATKASPWAAAGVAAAAAAMFLFKG